MVYEVLWTKHLSLIFGNTIFAVSIVTATFMAGLAIGSYLIGRFADRNINLLLLYGLLEVGIALTALLFVPTLNIVENLYVYWSHRLASLPWVATTINFLFSGMLLLPPAIFMGGTFPIMCRFFARNKSGGQIGRLYALNTIGATLGAFAAGYVLIPAYGLSRTSFLAIAGNLTVAGISFLLARKQGKTDAEGIEHKPQVREMVATKHRPILIAIGVIGFFSLAYEILWTRVFLLFLGNTSYAFALMLSAYLSGIAIGGFLYARLVHPQFNEKRLFIILTLLMGLTILATVPFYDQLAHVFQYAHEISGEQWWLLSSLSFVIVFLLMSVPTILSGALLPAAVAIIDPGKKHTGEGVGLVVLHNTFGA
ncbi:MAG: fused MFS/spermidine synthase, partial [Desulfuromonadales bacterium]|nr:fused MFS/spermidine synthase [Desulfuromonadales bacterium]